MKSNLKNVLTASLLVLLFSVTSCLSDEKPGCEVSVATMALPKGSDGLLHWRAGNTPTTPLQLSTRYFSERLKIAGNVIQFFKEPVFAVSAQELAPEPLVTLKIPAGQGLVYIVLSTGSTDHRQQPRWRGNLLKADDWKAGSMKVFNACSEPLGIAAGEKKIRLLHGKSVDFHARDWGDSFPVKIVRLKPKQKTIFSSSWRVATGRRELCFISGANGSIVLRSLIDLAAARPSAP